MKKKTEPMRIAQIMGKWLGGGVESVVMNYYRHIDKSKIQFDFICDEDSTNIPYDEIDKMGGKVILIPPYQKVFKYHKELKKVLKEGNYKIVHSHINTLSVFSLYAAKKAGVPVRIAHSHSTSNKKEWKKNIIKNILRPFSKVFATDYMCCSEHAGRWLFGNKAFDNGKVTIINNAIDIDKFRYNEKIRKEKRKELGIKDDTIVIGHIGRFVETKNQKFLIDIFNNYHMKNKNSVLLLIGQGPTYKKIKNKVQQFNLENSVIFLGQINDTSSYYNIMDLFILPSLYEGLGMVLIEAQCNGCPCIASTEVPKCVNIAKLVKFCKLDSNVELWMKNIDDLLKKNNRKHQIYDLIKNSRFNLNNEALILAKKYEDFNTIRICHIISGLKGGGVESMIYNYCSKMNNVRVKFYLLYQHEPSKKNLEEFEKINFVTKRISSKKYHPIKNFYETYKFLKDNKIDVVHCHMTIMNFIPLIAARMLHIKNRICHSHSSDNRPKKLLQSKIENILKKICIINATKLLACGEEAGKYLYSNNNFLIIPNAINMERFKFNNEIRKNIRTKYGIKDNEILIGHIGRFTEQKNHLFLIDLFNEIVKKEKNYKLLLIGNGENIHSIKEKIKKFNLSNHIIMTGIVSEPEQFYNAMDLFVLPSLWEGLPVAAIEAQANGLKCIVSNNIDHKIAITNKLQLLKLDKELWKKIILEENYDYSRKQEKEQFKNMRLDIESEYKKLEEIYIYPIRGE